METLSLNCSRIFKCDAKTLWKGIEDGAFFNFTGPIESETKFDFREGGKYFMRWNDCASSVEGEFKQIIPFKKVVFTWDKVLESDTDVKYNTLVTLDLYENKGSTLLTLKHEGFESLELCQDHHQGWDETLQDFLKSLKDVFSQAAENKNGLDFYYRHKGTINAPIEKVFEAVRDGEILSQYFPTNSADSFGTDKTVTWNFENYRPLELKTQNFLPNQNIQFIWEEMFVNFNFRKLEANKTEVFLEFTTSENNQEGLNGFVSESEGWGQFITRLKLYLEKGLINKDYR